MTLSATLPDPALTQPKERRLDRLTSTSIALMATVVANSALGMVFWVLASRHYSPAQLGENAALISAMMLLSVVAQLNLGIGIPRLLPQVLERRWRPIVAAYSSTAVVAVVVTTSFVVLAPRLSDGFAFLEGNVSLGLVMIASVVFWNVFALQDAALTAARWAVVVPIENAAFGMLKIGLMMVVASRYGGHGIFVAWVVAMAITLVPVNTLLFAKVLPTRVHATGAEPARLLPLGDTRRVAWYLVTDYAAGLLSHGYTALLPLLVIGVLGRSANAYFYVAFIVVVAVIGLTSSLCTSLVVEGAHDESELADLTRRTIRRYVIFVIPAVALLVAGATVVLWAFGPGYASNSSAVLRLLLLGTVPQSLVMLYLGVERVRAKVTRVLAVEAATVVLVTIGVVVGMRGWGLNGLGVAWLLSHSVVAIFVVPRLWRASRTQDEPTEGPTHPDEETAFADIVRSMTPGTQAGRSWSTAGDVVAVLLTASLLALAGLGMAGPLRTVLAVVFVTFVPGWAFLDHVRLAEGTSRVALAVALSLTICTAASLVPLWLRLWDPIVSLDVLGALSLMAVISHLALGGDPYRAVARARRGGRSTSWKEAADIWIGEVELSDSLLPSGVARDQLSTDSFVRVLVRLHGQFLGFITVPLNSTELMAETVAAAVGSQLEGPLLRHLSADGLAMPRVLGSGGLGPSHTCPQRSKPMSDELISVVVPTRDHPESLVACLNRLRRLRYGRFEVVVVDNAPTTASTKASFDRTVGYDSRFRYVVEPVPGLSRARNRGMSEAAGKYLAFTDDDVLVDEWWLDRIRAGFARDAHVGCVTGLVPAAEANPAQEYFERRYSWTSGTEGIYDLGERRDPAPLYPYKVGTFGTGANCAVDRDLLERLGGFDEALGAGTAGRGGEDLDMFVRVLRAGRSIVRDPSAIVWHVHRSDARALRKQLFSYGAGLSAFVTKYVADPGTRREVLSRVHAGFFHARRMWRPARNSARMPRVLVLTEALGMFFGPLAYFRSRRQLRRRSRGPS